MKLINTLILILFLLKCNLLFSQSLSFYGGFRPNNLYGTNFSTKVEVIKKRKWTFGINYSLVKYSGYSDFQPNPRPKFHIENSGDKTIFFFKDLHRGKPLQINEQDLRPKELIHRFSIISGKNIINNNDFIISAYGGPHFALSRTIQYSVANQLAPVIIKKGDEIQFLNYNDYQIRRFWDIGVGLNLQLEYKLYKNLYFGLNSSIFMDFIGEGIDLLIGGGITLNFDEI